MNRTLANFSTDLRRVSNWVIGGRITLAKNLLFNAQKKYQGVERVGPYKNVWDEVEKIKALEGGKSVAADRASTVSSILLQESFK